MIFVFETSYFFDVYFDRKFYNNLNQKLTDNISNGDSL